MRILLLELPKLLREILEQATLKCGGEVIRDLRDAARALSEGGPTPDVVVLGLSDKEDAPLVSAVLSRWPLAEVITLSSDASETVIYRSSLHTEALDQPSSDQILASFQAAIARQSTARATNAKLA